MTPYYQDDSVTLYHGDCRAVLPTLARVELVLTDPPYGIGFAAQPTKWQRRAGHQPQAWDDATIPDVVLNLTALADTVIVWGGNYYALPVSRGWLTWFKPDAPPSMSSIELAWTNLDMNARQISHSIGATNAERVGHPTQKPLRVIAWSLSQSRVTSGTVLDPFAGSGTTLRAAKDSGYRAIGIEIEERYCEMAARRLSQGALSAMFQDGAA